MRKYPNLHSDGRKHAEAHVPAAINRMTHLVRLALRALLSLSLRSFLTGERSDVAAVTARAKPGGNLRCSAHTLPTRQQPI